MTRRPRALTVCCKAVCRIEGIRESSRFELVAILGRTSPSVPMLAGCPSTVTPATWVTVEPDEVVPVLVAVAVLVTEPMSTRPPSREIPPRSLVAVPPAALPAADEELVPLAELKLIRLGTLSSLRAAVAVVPLAPAVDCISIAPPEAPAG